MTTLHHVPTPNHRSKGLIAQATSTKRRTSDELPAFLGGYVPTFSEERLPRSINSRSRRNWGWYYSKAQAWAHALRTSVGGWKTRGLLDVRLLLIAVWALLLWWGEEVVFTQKVGGCEWGRWEAWPAGAVPHHLVLIADPQLVDPHTYPGRPWPFSKLTIKYTDLYIRKNFQRIQELLDPDSVFFLGDLFDGGREWSPPGLERDASVDRRWWRYRQKYWMKEYRRFGRIFVDTWLSNRGEGRGRPRKMVTSLPGNHDLGLGSGIRIPVRKRFNAYFGEGNRIDLLGNHTFVSVDTVSLSAKGQLDPATGAPKQEEANGYIWGPAEEFLHQANAAKARAIKRHLRRQSGKEAHEPLEHDAIQLDDPRAHKITVEHSIDTDIPSVVLTHVPLYRAEGTPCGLLRERFPPSKQDRDKDGEPEKDDANSIHYRGGEQYQNTLTPAVSNELVSLIGDVTYVFSGDDHDYCEVMHREYTSRGGGIKEITVKSISWAMGIRRPGFLLVSLWNPLDENGKALGGAGQKTMQTHLCLLPDQLGIFIRYGLLLGLTIFILLVRSTRMILGQPAKDRQGNGHVLPLTKVARQKEDFEPPDTATSSTFAGNVVAVRGSAAKSTNNGHGYWSSPPDGQQEPDWQDVNMSMRGSRKGKRGFWEMLSDLRRSLGTVAWPVLAWYLWLLWHS